eukprot:18584-Heterococcus_DN1.PRE.3
MCCTLSSCTPQRRANNRAPHEELSIAEKSLAGAFSAIPATVIMAPVERVKCLLQHVELALRADIQTNKLGPGQTAQYTGPCVKVGKQHYYGIYQGPDGRVSTPALLTAGGVAGMANWAIAIPADVLKSRLQTAPEGKYTGVIDVYKTLMREEGSSALFRGMGPAMIRAFPANAACFFGVDVATRFLESMGLD